MIDDIEALRARFNASYTNPAPILRSNHDAVAVPVTSVYATMTIAPGASQRTSSTITHYRLEQLGRVIFQIFAPPATGTKAANDLAQHVRDIFEEWKTDDLVLRCGDADVDVYDQAKSYQINISISWRSSRLKLKPV